jgi:hypothetical protein
MDMGPEVQDEDNNIYGSRGADMGPPNLEMRSEVQIWVTAIEWDQRYGVGTPAADLGTEVQIWDQRYTYGIKATELG